MPSRIWVPENAVATLQLDHSTVDTTGMVIKAYAVDEADVSVEIGSNPGAAAGTAIQIQCDCSLITPGHYRIEIIADPASANPITLIPNVNSRSRVVLTVEPIASIA